MTVANGLAKAAAVRTNADLESRPPCSLALLLVLPFCLVFGIFQSRISCPHVALALDFDILAERIASIEQEQQE